MSRYPKVILAFIAVLVYCPTLFFGWVKLDDYLIVQRPSFFSNLSNIPAAFFRSVWDPAGQEYNFYRPVSTFVYISGGWLSRVVSGEILPWAFHLTNLVLFSAVVVLSFVLFRRLGTSVAAALAAGLLIVVHPFSVGTVAWIGGQNELLLAVFVLGAFISVTYLGRSPVWFLVHGVCFLFALLTKENAIALPVLCAIYLFFSSDRLSWRIWTGSILTWSVTVLIWFLMIRQGSGESGPDAGRALAAVFHGMPFLLVYLGNWIAPWSISPLPTSEDAGWSAWIGGGLFAAGLIFVLVFWARRKPMVLLGIAWFLGFLLPTFANIIPDQKNIYILRPDRGFLASIGILILLLQWDRLPPIKRNIKIFGVLAVAGLLALNFVNQLNYRNSGNFYRSAVAGSPRLPFARTHLGDEYLADKDYGRAIAEYQEAIRLNPVERQVHNNLGVAYLRMGRVDEAVVEFKRDIEITPTSLLAWPNLGYIYLNRGEFLEAEKAFRRSVEINPGFKDGWAGLIQVYTKLGLEEKRIEAVNMYNRAELDMKSGL